MNTGAESEITNALSFDVEHWYTATLLSDEIRNPQVHIDESVQIVLDLLAEYDVRSTFFIIGAVANEHPELVGKIVDAGHELASHGQTHTPLPQLTPDEFESELKTSRSALEDTTGVSPEGFRAPNFSVTKKTSWAFSKLAASSYQYDSSVFPMRTPMYGVHTTGLRPYQVHLAAPFDSLNPSSRESDIVEWPLAVTDTKPRLPIAGGFYARLLPVQLLSYGINRLNDNGKPANLYFHPWEFNSKVPTAEPPLVNRTISFHGVDGLAEKLRTLISAFEFDRIGHLLDGMGLCDTAGARTASGSHSSSDSMEK